MSSKPITAIIVEDHLLTRLGLTMVLDACPTIEVVGEADNGVSALQLIKDIKPDVAVVDIGLPQMDGIECTTIIKSSTCSSRILLRSSHQEDDAILAAIAAGADGFCLKDSSDTVLIEAIETVASGRVWLDSRIAKQIQTMLSPEPTPPKAHRQKILAASVKLTKDELEQLNGIANNSTNSLTSADATDREKPDFLRLLMEKIACALLKIN